MLQFCANLKWLFNEVAFLDRFDEAAKAGFTGVEYASPYEFKASELRSRLTGLGLRQVLINTPTDDPKIGGGNGWACVPGKQAEFRDGVRKALEYAHGLDCRLVHVMAGIQPADVPHDVAANVYATNIAWAAEQAKTAGVKLALEAINQRDVPGFFLRTQEQGAAVIAAIGAEQVGLQFDIYHCQVTQGDVTRRLEKLMPLIVHMQVADVPARNEPGTGEIAWDYVFTTIERLGYAGWIGCEYRPAQSTKAGLDWRYRHASVKAV
ncbi:MAG TPA: TIM barrel protein [Bradyrhizobium sp.]|nr:TIM barrel protein [Bradyrhizobium sp.]